MIWSIETLANVVVLNLNVFRSDDMRVLSGGKGSLDISSHLERGANQVQGPHFLEKGPPFFVCEKRAYSQAASLPRCSGLVSASVLESVIAFVKLTSK